MTMIKKNQEVHFSAHVWTRSQTINLTFNMKKYKSWQHKALEKTNLFLSVRNHHKTNTVIPAS